MLVRRNIKRRPSYVCCLRAEAGRKLADKPEKKHAREYQP
jgi:hypothetical protein